MLTYTHSPECCKKILQLPNGGALTKLIETLFKHSFKQTKRY